jgi:hypothetical protein
MSTETDEILEMQNFLGIREKPHNIWQAQFSREVGYEDWLTSYKRQLRTQCEDRLAEDFLKNLGARLFRERFHFFHEFQR